jgi:hypothetical protein
MTQAKWHIPGPPSQALLRLARRPAASPELEILHEAFVADPTVENLEKIKAEVKRLYERFHGVPRGGAQ